jgi:hypothetical protein
MKSAIGDKVHVSVDQPGLDRRVGMVITRAVAWASYHPGATQMMRPMTTTTVAPPATNCSPSRRALASPRIAYPGPA